MKYRMQWVVNSYRKNKRTGVQQPIKRSEYVQNLFNVGWKDEQPTDRKRTQRL
ncbi:hypothetical protein SAMN05216232_0197 [Virgibacillus subterraneus]|uniref:Helicase-associated domain-containing protein n=1 Tax=Virgibacillus subterraneus TaxID=621109 RepID=A0A1H8YYA7_9BACI|nr:hypothetical protein SAMN05216232_0197 [Virgibacillus subterraneus]